MEKEFKFLIYNSADDNVSVNAIVKDESVRLTQKAMGELFGVDRTSIGRHLHNIFNEGELDEKVVCAKIALTTQHGAMSDKTQTKETQFYNHYAITEHTAAELIFNNADSSKDNMGLTTWKNSPKGRILKSDTTIATSASSCTCCRNGCG